MSRTRTTVSSLAALCSIGTAGCLFTFNLFSVSIAKSLGLTMAQTNTIAIGSLIGQYSTAVIFGSLVDRKVLLGLGYSLMALSLSKAQNSHNSDGYPFISFVRSYVPSSWLFLASFFACCGAGSTASYFASVTTLVKTYPSYPGLAVGIPCAVFGSAPVICSRLSIYFTDNSGELDAVKFLSFLAVISAVFNLIGAALLRVPETPSSADTKKDLVNTVDENLPLLGPTTTPVVLTLKQYITHPQALCFGLIFLLAAGPAEMIMACIGSISETLIPAGPISFGEKWPTQTTLQVRSQQIQALAIANTVSRLTISALSDIICPDPLAPDTQSQRMGLRRLRISRLYLLAASLVAFAISLFWASARLQRPSELYSLTIPSGIAMGFVYTLAPGSIACRFGLESFGRNWGLTTLFGAVGASLFTGLFGLFSDWQSQRDHSPICHGHHCFSQSLALAGVAVTISMVLALRLSSSRGCKGKV